MTSRRSTRSPALAGRIILDGTMTTQKANFLHNLKKGLELQAKWKDCHWYDAVVVGVNGSMITVKYEDGIIASVPNHQVKEKKKVPVKGSKNNIKICRRNTRSLVNNPFNSVLARHMKRPFFQQKRACHKKSACGSPNSKITKLKQRKKTIETNILGKINRKIQPTVDVLESVVTGAEHLKKREDIHKSNPSDFTTSSTREQHALSKDREVASTEMARQCMLNEGLASCEVQPTAEVLESVVTGAEHLKTGGNIYKSKLRDFTTSYTNEQHDLSEDWEVASTDMTHQCMLNERLEIIPKEIEFYEKQKTGNWSEPGNSYQFEEDSSMSHISETVQNDSDSCSEYVPSSASESQTEHVPSDTGEDHTENEFDSDISESYPLLPQKSGHSHSDVIELNKSSLQSNTQNKILPNLNSLNNSNDSASVSDSAQAFQKPSLEADSSGVISVATTSNASGRKWDKRFSCLYCCKRVAKLPRHLYSHHKSEAMVCKIMNTADKVEKQALLTKVRHLGSFNHNNKTLKNKKGTLIVKYRPKVAADISRYVPCKWCFGYYVKEELWRHVKRCRFNKNITKSQCSRPVRDGRLLMPTGEMDDNVKDVLADMKRDRVFLIIKGDPLILNLASRLARKSANEQSAKVYTRCRLREIGRLIMTLRNSEPNLENITLTELLDPRLFKKVINAVRMLSGYSEDECLYRIPSIAVKLGHSLIKCCCLLKSIALQEENETLEKRADAFAQLCTSDWDDEISGSARRTLQKRKLNQPLLLPLTEDVQKLTQYVNNMRNQSIKNLKLNPSNTTETFKSLAQSTLASIVLFNRRRQGEVSKMNCEMYRSASEMSNAMITDVQESLSPLEQKLCKNFKRIEIIGKRQRHVPILLTSEHCEAMALLTCQEHRQQAGINPENPFVFPIATRGSTSYIRASDVLRIMSTECGAKYPNNLRSTLLRKHIAVLSQILNLKDNELDLLAQFLGHDIAIHREYYRLPNDVLQTAKVAKVLLAMEKGTMSSLKGKSLDEIQIEENEVAVVESDENLTDSEQEKGKQLVSTKIKKRMKQVDVTHSDAKLQALSQENILSKGSRKRFERIPWTETEKKAVEKHFKSFIQQNILPGKRAIEDVLRKEPILSRRQWCTIKDHIRNTYLK